MRLSEGHSVRIRAPPNLSRESRLKRWGRQARWPRQTGDQAGRRSFEIAVPNRPVGRVMDLPQCSFSELRR